MTSSAPSAASRSVAARSNIVLCESRRRLPLMPRTRIELRLLDELEVGDQRDLVLERRLTARQGVVPVHAELRAVDGRLELDAEALIPVRVVLRLRDRAADLDRL